MDRVGSCWLAILSRVVKVGPVERVSFVQRPKGGGEHSMLLWGLVLPLLRNSEETYGASGSESHRREERR